MQRSASSDLKAQATHLVVFQHGLWGNEKDFRSFQTLFQQYFPQDEIYAHIATSNATSLTSLFQTYDGIDAGGTRLADEVVTIATEMPRLAKFSIMGHSLGGLYARYCIGVLFARGFFHDVEPMNFVTLATPHMGIRRSQPTPMNAMFNVLMPNFFDLTGQQFTLTDTVSDQTRELSRSVRRYPHRRPNVVYADMDGMLLVQLPHKGVAPAKTPIETKTFELVECILREGVLHLYRKKEAVDEPTCGDKSGDSRDVQPVQSNEHAAEEREAGTSEPMTETSHTAVEGTVAAVAVEATAAEEPRLEVAAVDHATNRRAPPPAVQAPSALLMLQKKEATAESANGTAAKQQSETEEEEEQVDVVATTASDASKSDGVTIRQDDPDEDQATTKSPQPQPAAAPKPQVEVIRIAEIDLLDAVVTIALPEKSTRKRRNSKRRASEASFIEEPTFWDIEIELSGSNSISTRKEKLADADAKSTAGTAKYTIRIPYDELTAKWKWIVALSNASHGVHCRSQSAPTTVRDTITNSVVAPSILSCLTRGQFIQALQLFRTRTVYSSIFNDLSVPYSCGAIRAFNPYRNETNAADAARSPFYSHIVMRSLWNAPLLRDTLPEDVKNRAERASSVDRFSLVRMLSERSRSNSSLVASSRDQSFSSFFSNLTSSNASSRTRTRAQSQSQSQTRSQTQHPPAPMLSSQSSVSSASSSAVFMQQRLDAIPPALAHSVRSNIGASDDDSDGARSSMTSPSFQLKECKRRPPFEDGALLLDHVDVAFSNDELRDSLRGMMVSLQSVGWRRIDVHFHSPLAHMKIIAMTANPTKPLTKGLDVVHHVMDTFLL